MAGHGRSLDFTERVPNRRRPFQDVPAERAGGDSEPVADALETFPPPLLRDTSHPRSQASITDFDVDPTTARSYLAPQASEQAPASTFTSTVDPTSRARGFRRNSIPRGHRRGGRDSSIDRYSRGNTTRRRGILGGGGITHETSYEHDLVHELENELLGDGATQAHTEVATSSPRSSVSWNFSTAGGQNDAFSARRSLSAIDGVYDDWDDYGPDIDTRLARVIRLTGGLHSSVDDTATGSSSLHSFHRMMTGATKRPRDKYEHVDGKDITRTLDMKGAVAVVLYNSTIPDPGANDIWPECRSTTKFPSRYFLLDRSKQAPSESYSKRRPSKQLRTEPEMQPNPDGTSEHLPVTPAGRPEWKLPVELVELIASFLNRDDIKSLRLVSRELSYYVSQVIFKTVVVPFNTEIYGMLGQEPKPDLKGKKRAKIENLGYTWKNASGDEVYNGHGLDVFRGFGKHILRYGMSFEVNEDSLATPPAKSLTEKKTSFWGNYEWPFEEYRRFDTVAGLETAADETPRMKIAFSELSKVNELALSVDSGLGWLNGPDRSIRARILQKSQQVFGTSKDIPDRRAQAQQELWRYIEACHQSNGSDIKLATLYRMDGQRPLSDLMEASMVAREQPDMPYLDPRLIHDATPHDSADLRIPPSFDDPEVLDCFVLRPPSFGGGTGVLFSSNNPPTDAGQIMSSIIPANLTKAQKEWLLETEWAQRAFMSSYMLSIIDNPLTFGLVHTLNIARLSAHYLSMLNRTDFWGALPNLSDVTLMVIPAWRAVHKDEAGFVDTPKISPSRAISPFYDLLRTHIVWRPNIRKLTIGWVTGGEHAEGLHARNKLILPAPLMSSIASDMLVGDNINELRENLLHFPHVRRLTLRNCWITPPTVVQLVRIHEHGLKHLVLDSVSLTAILRQNPNANQAAQPAAGLNPHIGIAVGALWNALNNNGGAQAGLQAQTQLLPNQQQFLQIYIQTIQVQLQQLQANAVGIQQQNQITALQNQLQQAQQLQNQNIQQFNVQAPGQGWQQNPQAQPHLNHNSNLATQAQSIHHQIAAVQPPPVPSNIQPQLDSQSVLKARPREGSWVNIIDIISPGTNLSDFGSEHSQADAQRSTSLRSITFISCGYAKLPHASFDQTAIDPDHGIAAALRNAIFAKRYNALTPAMLSAKWAHLGEIVQEVDVAELAALDAGWNLKTGWDDAEEARAVEFDGLLPGGTGRFTGKVQASDRVAEVSSAS
ncbi:Nn.00g008250.m01.CDS01 [Neocucurbitaria sp. VM-36]